MEVLVILLTLILIAMVPVGLGLFAKFVLIPVVGFTAGIIITIVLAAVLTFLGVELLLRI